MEKGMAGDRTNGAAAGATATSVAPAEPMIKPGLINLLDGTTASLDDHPNWPMHGPAGELYGADGSRLIRDENGRVSYFDADGNERTFHEWARPAEPGQPDGMGERVNEIWSAPDSDGYFGGPHPNDIAQQLSGGSAPDFGSPRSLQQIRAERAR